MSVNKPENYHHPVAWDTAFEPMAMPDLLGNAAKKTPDAPLADFSGRTFSYGELWHEAQRFAAGLQALGVGKGDRVGLFLPNVPIYVSAYYGAMLAGATVVNFSPLYTPTELAAQVEDSGATILVTVDVTALLGTAIEVLEKSSLKTLIVGRLSDALSPLKKIALKIFGRSATKAIPSRPDVLRWDRMLASAPPQAVAIEPDHIALLQYTGGTTGTPKGAMLTHANLSINAQQVDAIDPFDRSDRDAILGALPLFHVFANTCVLNRTVLRGGCIVMLPRFDAKQALKTISRTRPTAFPGVPTMYQALLDESAIGGTDFSSLKICISGGAALPETVSKQFEEVSQARLVEGYGLTESSGVVSTNPYVGTRKKGTIGQPLPQTEVRLVDKEDPTLPLTNGDPGELVIRGPQVMKGYWNRPDADGKVFVELDGQRWLRTGDIATIDADGFIKIVDRSKDMIAVSGFKVFPSQVEAVLLEYPAVKEALVLGLPDDYRGESPHGYVTLLEGVDVTGADIADWANQRLGKHERLTSVTVREELPKTMIGKLDRKALKTEILGES